MDVAAHSALPKELPERMLLPEAPRQESRSFERKSASYAQLLAFHDLLPSGYELLVTG